MGEGLEESLVGAVAPASTEEESPLEESKAPMAKPESKSMSNWKKFLLLDEPLTFRAVQRFLRLERPNKFPTEEELAAYLRNVPEEAIKETVKREDEVKKSGGDVDEIVEEYGRFQEFSDFEIKRIEDLKHWNKIRSYLEAHNLKPEGVRVIVIDNDEYWKNFYGSNDSKSGFEPKTIIIRKGVFEEDGVSDEDLSWIVHEVAHLSFYDFLDEKTAEYIAGTQEPQKYIKTAMESIAFQAQIAYLKSLGKTKESVSAFVGTYIEKSFGRDEEIDDDQREVKQKELAQLMKYVDNVYYQ